MGSSCLEARARAQRASRGRARRWCGRAGGAPRMGTHAIDWIDELVDAHGLREARVVARAAAMTGSPRRARPCSATEREKLRVRLVVACAHRARRAPRARPSSLDEDDEAALGAEERDGVVGHLARAGAAVVLGRELARDLEDAREAVLGRGGVAEKMRRRRPRRVPTRRDGVAGPVMRGGTRGARWRCAPAGARAGAGSSQKTSRRSRGSLAAVSSSIASAASVSRRAVATLPCAAASRARASSARHAHSLPACLRARARGRRRARARAASSSPASMRDRPAHDLGERLVLAEARVAEPAARASSSRRQRRRVGTSAPRACARAAPRAAPRPRRAARPCASHAERALLVERGAAREVARAHRELGLETEELRARGRRQLVAARRERARSSRCARA